MYISRRVVNCSMYNVHKEGVRTMGIRAHTMDCSISNYISLYLFIILHDSSSCPAALPSPSPTATSVVLQCAGPNRAKARDHHPRRSKTPTLLEGCFLVILVGLTLLAILKYLSISE